MAITSDSAEELGDAWSSDCVKSMTEALAVIDIGLLWPDGLSDLCSTGAEGLCSCLDTQLRCVATGQC